MGPYAEVDIDLEFANLRSHSLARIADRIESIWGTSEAVSYLNSLIIDYRGNRSGFPRSVMSSLLKLYSAHPSLGQPDGSNPWITTRYQ